MEYLSEYKMPDISLLRASESGPSSISAEELNRTAAQIKAVLSRFRIKIDGIRCVTGPSVSLFKVFLSPGEKPSSFWTRKNDIEVSLHRKGVRAVSLEDSIGIEIGNENHSYVPFRGLLYSRAFRDTSAELPIALGYSVGQSVKVIDLTKAPHILVTGATKQGKSVCINCMIASLLYSKRPEDLKLVFIDPKGVEFKAYSGLINHYLAVSKDSCDRVTTIATTAPEAVQTLESLCSEMERRYSNSVTRSPFVVCFFDEFADFLSVHHPYEQDETKVLSQRIINCITRLAVKGHGVGIHLVIATQSQSTDVITGHIKANFHTRIAFRTAFGRDTTPSGSEKLIGNGDMLLEQKTEISRLQGGFISNEDIKELVAFISSQTGAEKSFHAPFALPVQVTSDTTAEIDYLKDAAIYILLNQRASKSELQRALGVGAARAGRIMDRLETLGIIGPSTGNKPRDIFVHTMAELGVFLHHCFAVQMALFA